MLLTNPNLVPLWIAIISGVFAGVGFLFKWYFGDKRKSKKEYEEKRKMPKLVYHPVFNELDELESYFLTRYRHPDLGRQMIASEMMVHKIRIWRPILTEFAEKVDLCCAECNLAKPDCNKVLNLSVNLLIDGMEEYIDWHNKDVVVSADGHRTYSKTDKETMNIYIKKFQMWHESREELVKMITHDVGNGSTLYDTCYQQAFLILQGYHLAFALCRSDSDKTLKSLNGSITGKMFLGIKIGEMEERRTLVGEKKELV